MKRALHLRFDGASLITQGSLGTWDDLTFDYGGQSWEDRKKEPLDKDCLIPKRCIANVLQVLCGMRPVPHRLKEQVTWGFHDDVLASVEECYIRYDYDYDLGLYISEKGCIIYKTFENTIESFHSGKAKVCTHAKHSKVLNNGEKIEGIHTWRAWRKYLGADLYEEVLREMGKMLTFNKAEETLYDVISRIREKGLTNLYIAELLAKKMKTALSYIFNGGRLLNCNYNSYNTNTPNIVQHGIKTKLVMGGDIIVLINDNVYDMIMQGEGTATLLDGGVVRIISVEDEDDMDTDENLEYKKYKKI